jgi:conjugal transfer/entry exclusion protein
VASLKGMAADVDAVKAYFKQVSDSMRAMRDDMVRLLDEQSQRVEEGRQEYVRILQAQEQVLKGLLPELVGAG